jgi:hypothetical protein
MEYPNWFKQIAQHNFEQFLTPLAGEIRLKFLQLGVFTGDASVWMCKNILTAQSSTLDDVDTWRGAANEPIQEEMDFEDVYKTYLDKTAEYKKTIRVNRCTTTDHLLAQYGCDRPLGEYFDFIYVDAHHTSASAFLDCELSWPLLNSGGILAIDDYEWLHPDGVEIHGPQLGIHMFLDRHDGEYKLLVKNQQVWLRKH